MRKHSKVELSVDFTELMTQSFIFNSQVGVLNVKRCKNEPSASISPNPEVKYIISFFIYIYMYFFN